MLLINNVAILAETKSINPMIFKNAAAFNNLNG